jgi:predicted KAP-like P-loop ATPase
MLIPDHETAVDFLNYEAISKTVVELIKDNRQRALTIGIHGDWGAGKSSVLKMVETEIRQDKEAACLWFNGWTFQGFDDAKTVLIEATISELCRQRSGVGKVKELSKRLIKRIDWLKLAKRGGGLAFTLATGLPSPDQIGTMLRALEALATDVKSMSPDQIQAKMSEAASLLKPGEGQSVPEEIHEFREEFSKLLDEAKINQLVVLIDDLDRCLPATAIDTLEAIRLFLFVPKTAFVIGADEAMIEYAVRQHFPNLPLTSGPIPYARNYLEKLVQIPFRIPALGIQETRTYVTLLLIEALVGEGHAGFVTLLGKARTVLNQPWLGSGLAQVDARAVDTARQAGLDATYLLAQQIGPILAEGTKGNPRQIKRFLNALLVRRAIAKARGFGDSLNQPALAKLMLAERFQPDFYEQIAGAAMVAKEGKVSELDGLETAVREAGKGARSERKRGKDTDGSEPREPAVEKWLERDWLRRWAGIEPALGANDLRPYIFVGRDKRVLAAATELGGLEGLIDKLCGPEMAIRSVEPDVRALTPGDADQVFMALRERVISHGSFGTPPPGFDGLAVVAKHHGRFQGELLTLVGSVDVNALGVWIVKGWNDTLTETPAKEQFNALIDRWAAQDTNAPLKRAAAAAVATRRGGRP